MNIVDLITSQLSGDVLGKLGGLIGASESQTRSATTAAVPAILGSLAKIAASGDGAGRIAGALGGLDLGMLGNLAGALSGAGGSNLGRTGGDLLGSLLGSGGLSTLVKLLGTFASMNPDMTRKLLGYLAPIVLGIVAKQFTGRPDAGGVSRLFSEQQSNISRAMPSGLSLADVAPQKAGMPAWLPLAALVALAAGGWYFLNQQKANEEERNAGVKEQVTVIEEVVVTKKPEEKAPMKEEAKADDTKLPAAVTDALKVAGGAAKLGTDLTGLLGGLGEVLGGVKDVDTATAALPKLEGFAPTLEAIEKGAAALPEGEKATIADLVTEKLGPLQKVIDTVMAIPGVKEILGKVVTPMVEALAKLGK
jgi:hypothetical protein